MSQTPRGTLAPNSGNMNTRQLLSNSVYTQSLSSSCGRIGPPGPPGGTGPKGDIGFKGAIGDKGIQGDKGPVGPQGDIGPLGAKGPLGLDGPKGPQGDKGDRGPQGLTGNTGFTGEKGSKGDIGPIGLTGPAGDVSTGNLDMVLKAGNISDFPAYISEIRTNILEPYSGKTITLGGGYLKIIDSGTQIITTSPYNTTTGVYININGVTFTDSHINTSTLNVYNGVTLTGQLYASGISTNGSVINTQRDGVSSGKIYAGGDIVAYQGIYGNNVDSISTASALLLGSSASYVTISRSGTTTTIASSLICNSSITGTNINSTNNSFSINNFGGGTFSGISTGNVNLNSLTSNNFNVTSSGIATMLGITLTGGITLNYLTGNGFSVTSGIGSFTGLTSQGITTGYVNSNSFSINSSGEAALVKVNCGGLNGVNLNGTSIWMTNNSISSQGATLESVTCNGAMVCKSSFTIQSSSTSSVVPLVNINTGSTTMGMFSRRNGISITASGAIDLSTIPYDSVINVNRTFSINIVLPTDPSNYSPLRFYLYNNNNVTHTLSCSSQILWGPATGYNTPVTFINLNPYKKVCVVVMTTGIGYIQSTDSITGHYFVSYETTSDIIDTISSGVISVGTTNATGITIGNNASTTIIRGLTLTSAGISYSGNTMMLGDTLSTISIGANTTTTTIKGLTLTSAGISYSGNTVMLGNTLSTISIGANTTTTTINGLTLTSAGISYSGNTVILGNTLSTISIGANTTTTTVNGLTLTSAGISYSGNTIMLGNTLSTISIGANTTTTTVNGLTLTSAGISYSGNTVMLGNTLSTISIGANTTITTIRGLTLTSAGISYSGNTVMLGDTLTTLTMGANATTITMGANTTTSTIRGLTLTSAGISYSGNTVMLGDTLTTITMGANATTTTIRGLTLTSAGISYSGNTVMLGNTLTTITIGANTTTTTLNGLTMTSAGISYSGNTVMLGNTLTTITIGANTTTTTIRGLTLTSAGISYSGNTVMLGDTLTTITIGANTTTTTIRGLTLTSAGISYSGNTVMLGNTLTTITVGANTTTTTIRGLTLTSAGISYSGNTMMLGDTLTTLIMGANATTITMGANTTTTTLNGLTLTSAGISYSGNTMMLGDTLTTISVGNATSATSLLGTVTVNNPTVSTHVASKAYSDMIELNTLYLTSANALSLTSSGGTVENTTLISFSATANTLVGTYTLPSSSSALYVIKEGYIIVNLYIKLFNTNALTFVCRFNNQDSTNVTISTNTTTLSRLYIPVTANTVINSNSALTINAQSTTTTVTNAVTIYADVGGDPSKLLFVSNAYKLYHQLYNPVGTIVLYGGRTTSPPGYVFCDGTLYSTSSSNNPYYLLYLAIGTNYGSGTGTFAVPNLINRFPIGSNTTSTINSQQNVVYGGSLHITEAQMPSHTHRVNGVVTNTGNFDTPTYGAANNTDKEVCRAVINTSGVTSEPTGTASAYFQPYTVVNYIIKY